jgi:hypothetical protein
MEEPLLTSDETGIQENAVVDADEHSEHDEDDAPRDIPTVSCLSRLNNVIVHILHRPLIPEADEELKLQIRFLKFLALTVLGIVTVRMIVVSLVRTSMLILHCLFT